MTTLKGTIMRAFIAALAFVLTGCVSLPGPGETISVPVPSPGAPPPLAIQPSEALIEQLKLVRDNFDAAIAAAVMAKDDPRNLCLHRFLVRAGVETEPGATSPKELTLKGGGLLVKGANAYILKLIHEKYGGKVLTISPQCRALLGDWVGDGIESAGEDLADGLSGKIIKRILR